MVFFDHSHAFWHHPDGSLFPLLTLTWDLFDAKLFDIAEEEKNPSIN